MEFISGTAKQLNSYNESTYNELANYRYQVFVEKLGWELDTPEGFEKDQFDREDTIYVVSRDESQQINGCARLLPTIKPYLLGEVFPQLLNGGPIPSETEYWELSRFTVNSLESSSTLQQGSEATYQLMDASMRIARENGAKYIIGVTTLMLERLFRRINIRCHRLGVPQKIDGFNLVALKIDLEEQLG